MASNDSMTNGAAKVNSSSWWLIDRTQSTLQSIHGATPLLEVCIETYGWKEDKARRVLTGYRQFLELKKRLGDYDGDIVEPSNAVDEVWVQHYSTRSYAKDCELLCGGFVKRDGYNRLDHVTRGKRIQATRPLLISFYKQDVDNDVWDFGVAANSIVPMPKKKGIEAEEQEGAQIMFRPFASHAGLSESQYEIAPNTNFVVVACLYAEDQGREFRELHFLVEGNEVIPERTLEELGFVHGQVVDVFYRQVPAPVTGSQQ